MKYKEEKQFRYKGYDYSQNGFYFVTICTKNREMFFGKIKNERMILSAIGVMVDKCWSEIPNHFPFVVLDDYVVMPDHVHGIIQIDNIRRNTKSCVPTTMNISATQNRVETKDRVGTQNTVGTQDFVFLQNEYQNKFGPQSKNLSSVIRGFKVGVTKSVRMAGTKNMVGTHKNNESIWQSRFHDHIIRNDDELNRIRKYIVDNPVRWDLDRNNKEELFM